MKMAERYLVYYNDGGKEIFPYNIDHYVRSIPSTVYSPQLAHILAAFSYSVYEEENAKRSMESFGFEDPQRDYKNDLIGYMLAKKGMSDGKTLVLVLIRGSSTVTEWMSNFNLFESTKMEDVSLHTGFWDAAVTVYNALESYLAGTWENTVFVLTGHSRGAAAANILGKYLTSHNGIDPSCIYDYTIACPDVAAGSDSDWNPDEKCDNIFNIANAKDPVSLVPGALGKTFFGRGEDNWGKFGNSYWFTENEKEIEINPSTHELSVYLNYLQKEYSLSSYQSREELNAQRTDKVLNFGPDHIRFPVDVEIINEEGEKIASLIGGEMNFYGLSAETTHGAFSGIKLLQQLKPAGIHMDFRNDETAVGDLSGKPLLRVSTVPAEERSSEKRHRKKGKEELS